MLSETSKYRKKGIKSRNYYEKLTNHARKRVYWYNINLPFNNAAIDSGTSRPLTNSAPIYLGTKFDPYKLGPHRNMVQEAG